MATSSNGSKVTEDKFSELENKALELVSAAHTPEEVARIGEGLKSIAEARTATTTARSHGLLSKLGAATPVLALLVTLITIVYQAGQTAILQQKTGEDEQWREALKLVSFKDSDTSEAGAYALQGFFTSPRYGFQAQSIASTLLTNVKDVKGFDAVLGLLRKMVTNCDTFVHVSSVATSLGLAQRAKYNITGAASRANTPFLREADRIYLGEVEKSQTADRDLYVAAWKIATASDYMRDIWWKQKNEGKGSLCEGGTVLVGAVLENSQGAAENSFDTLDFSKMDLSFAILSRAHFRNAIFANASLRAAYLNEVDLTGADMTHVNLAGADLSGVKEFAGSKWADTRWWEAKCVPQPLIDYLSKAVPPPKDVKPEDLQRLASSCM